MRSCCFILMFGLLLPGCSSQLQPRSNYAPPPGAALQEVGEIDTGHLEPSVGHQDDQLGVKVIGSTEDGDEQVIEIEVPVEPDSVDQVHVYSSQPGAGSGSVVLTREAQIVQNYESNNVGISVRIPKSENLGFRLKLIDHPNDEWPPRRYQ